jgi:hypothetical protein
MEINLTLFLTNFRGYNLIGRNCIQENFLNYLVQFQKALSSFLIDSERLRVSEFRPKLEAESEVAPEARG